MDSHKSYSFFQQQISQLSERNKNIRNHQNQQLKQFTDVIKIIIPLQEEPEKTAEINFINIFDDFNNSTQYKQKFSKELEEILSLSQSYQYVTKEKLQKLSAKSKSKLIKYLINTVFDQSKNLIYYDTSYSQVQLQNNPITNSQYITYKENLDLLKKFSKVTTMCTKFSRILDPLEILKQLDSEEQKKQEQYNQNLTNIQNFQSAQNSNLMTFNSQENFLNFDQNASPKEYIFQKGQIPSQFLSPQSSKSLEKSTFITDKNDNFSTISDQQISKNDKNFRYKSLEKSRQKSIFNQNTPCNYQNKQQLLKKSIQENQKNISNNEEYTQFSQQPQNQDSLYSQATKTWKKKAKQSKKKHIPQNQSQNDTFLTQKAPSNNIDNFQSTNSRQSSKKNSNFSLDNYETKRRDSLNYHNNNLNINYQNQNYNNNNYNQQATPQNQKSINKRIYDLMNKLENQQPIQFLRQKSQELNSVTELKKNQPYLYPKYLDTVGPSLQPQLKQNMDLEQFDDFRREYIKDRIHEDEQGIEQLVKEYEKEINLQQGTIQTLRKQISQLCISKQYDQNEYDDNQRVKYYTEKINKFKQVISNLNNLMGEKDQEMQQLKRKDKLKLVNKVIENNYVKKLQIAQKEKNYFQQRNDDLMQNTEALSHIIEDLKKQNLQLNKKIDKLYKHGRKLSCDEDNEKENKNNQNLLQLKIKNQNAKLEKIVENEISDLLQKFLKQQGLTNFVNNNSYKFQQNKIQLSNQFKDVVVKQFQDLQKENQEIKKQNQEIIQFMSNLSIRLKNNFGTNNPEVKKTNEFMRQFILQQINI